MIFNLALITAAVFTAGIFGGFIFFTFLALQFVKDVWNYWTTPMPTNET